MMGSDEIQIFELLKTLGDRPISPRELARRLGGKRRLLEDPNWVRPVLQRMLMQEIIQIDGYGQYQLKMRAKPVNKPRPRPEPQKLPMDKWETWELVVKDKPRRKGRDRS